MVQVSGGVTNTGIYNTAVWSYFGGPLPEPVRIAGPTLTDSRVTVSGGAASYGLYNSAIITTSGASVYYTATLTATVQGSRLDVRDGSANYGLYAV